MGCAFSLCWRNTSEEPSCQISYYLSPWIWHSENCSETGHMSPSSGRVMRAFYVLYYVCGDASVRPWRSASFWMHLFPNHEMGKTDPGPVQMFHLQLGTTRPPGSGCHGHLQGPIDPRPFCTTKDLRIVDCNAYFTWQSLSQDHALLDNVDKNLTFLA